MSRYTMQEECSASIFAERLARMETMQTNVSDKIDAILDQVRKTNGRVNEHDRWIERHDADTKNTDAALNAVNALVRQHEVLVNKVHGAWWLALILCSIAGGVVGLALHVLSEVGARK